MQPPEPTPEPAPPTPSAVPPAWSPSEVVTAPAKRHTRRFRLWLAIGAGIIALLCLGGVGIAVSLYDNATKIKRSEPDAVVDNFLRAYLVNRDDERASLYECKSGGDFAEIANYRADIATREKQFSVGIRISWSTFTIEKDGKQGTVTTDLIKTTSDQSGRASNPWHFVVLDQDGWRVCGATEGS